MKKDEDFRIQRFLDKKMNRIEKENMEPMDIDDLKAYELLYDHLKEKPRKGLSLSFKSNVLKQIEIERKQASDTKLYWLLGFVLLCGIVMVTLLFLIFKETLLPSFEVMNKYIGFFVVGMVAIISFTIVEKRAFSNDLR